MNTKIGLVNIDRYKDRVFFSLSVGRWSNRLKVSNSAALLEYHRLRNSPDETPQNYEPGAKLESAIDAVTSTKRLIDPKEPTLKAINDFLNETKKSLIGEYEGIAMPSGFMRGVYIVKRSLVERVEEIIAGAQAKLRSELAPAFAADFENCKERARTKPVKTGGLGPLFDPSDYADGETIADRFTLQGQYLQIGVSDQLSEELRAKKQAEFDAKIENALENSLAALREGFAGLIDHAVEKLTVEPGEKPKTFKGSLVDNLANFIQTFKAKDFGDEALAQLVEKAEKIIKPNGETIDPDRLRKFANVRDQVREQFAGIQASLDGMIVERKSRKIDLSED